MKNFEKNIYLKFELNFNVFEFWEKIGHRKRKKFKNLIFKFGLKYVTEI
jgi:hypothetical protein